MVTNYYDNIYRQKLEHKGENLSHKAVSRGKQEFERYLATTPTRQSLKLLEPPLYNDGELFYASIQGPSSQNVVADRYEKNILGSLNDNLKIGDIFQWKDENWIILTQERLSIPTHFKGKIRVCNHFLKWNVQGDIYKVPGHIITSRAFALDEGQKAGLLFDEQGMVVQAVVPQNEITNTINRYHRFILKNKAWKVVNIDCLSVDKLIFIRLEEDQIDRARDDLENGIADKYYPQPETKELIEGYTYTVEGPARLVWNQKGQYDVYQDNDLVDYNDISVNIIESDMADIITNNPIIIKANSNGLVGNFTIEFVIFGTKTITKEVRVTSLWGGD